MITLITLNTVTSKGCAVSQRLRDLADVGLTALITLETLSAVSQRVRDLADVGLTALITLETLR